MSDFHMLFDAAERYVDAHRAFKAAVVTDGNTIVFAPDRTELDASIHALKVASINCRRDVDEWTRLDAQRERCEAPEPPSTPPVRNWKRMCELLATRVCELKAAAGDAAAPMSEEVG